jgi:hypothetical protein
MGNRDIGLEARDGACERGRGVALDDDQIGGVGERVTESADQRGDMVVRIGLARTVQLLTIIGIQAKVGRREIVLPGEDDGRIETAGSQRTGNRLQLDGFGPGADDQTNIGETQPSPYLGGSVLPPLWS